VWRCCRSSRLRPKLVEYPHQSAHPRRQWVAIRDDRVFQSIDERDRLGVGEFKVLHARLSGDRERCCETAAATSQLLSPPHARHRCRGRSRMRCVHDRMPALDRIPRSSLTRAKTGRIEATALAKPDRIRVCLHTERNHRSRLKCRAFPPSSRRRPDCRSNPS